MLLKGIVAIKRKVTKVLIVFLIQRIMKKKRRKVINWKEVSNKTKEALIIPHRKVVLIQLF